MPLVGMSLQGYRCFAERLDIELRPITVVLGRNNSGKSALVRAPVVLATGIRTSSPTPLDLDQVGEEMVDSFADLVHGGFANDRGIRVALTVDGPAGRATVEATIRHFREAHCQLVDGLELWLDGARRARLELELDDRVPAVVRYTVDLADASATGVPVEFRGLLPDTAGGERAAPEAGRAIRDGFPEVRYLGPFRERPRRRYRLPGRPKADVGAVGEHAAGIVIDDVARREGRLLRQLNADIERHLPGWRVDARSHDDTWSLVLTARADARVSVNLADTGTGVAQALPIFVQRAVDALNTGRPDVLEIVEQPELHLHPQAHAELAELYVNAVERSGTRFLIETHSETFLLRLRRKIAEGLDPATVAVYFVEQDGSASSARRIFIDENGDVDYWPEGIFTEDYEETRALAEAQLRREEQGAR